VKATRGELLDRLAEAIESVTTVHPLRVAVDGPPDAGKTTLADELALLLRARGREVIRSPTESFHLPQAQRYRRGEYSSEGCYHDSFDYDALRRVLLDPLGPNGHRRYQHAIYNSGTDTALPGRHLGEAEPNTSCSTKTTRSSGLKALEQQQSRRRHRVGHLRRPLWVLIRVGEQWLGEPPPDVRLPPDAGRPQDIDRDPGEYGREEALVDVGRVGEAS
jgi:hypothetical protein